jgi:5-methylcytosine-specific restriction endonuclease McrA
MKTCNRCHESKPLDGFTRNGTRLYSICKVCRADTSKAYRARPEVSEREKQRLAAAYQARKAELSERRKARYAANKQAALEKNREWRGKNLERHRDLCRQWARENPESMRAIVAKRRAIRNAAEGCYTAEDIAKLRAEQDGRCNCCGERLSEFHVDHVIPLSRGGSNWPTNLQLLCPPCNLSKADKLPEEFEAYRAANGLPG